MSARVADDDCRLLHHYVADDRRCHRVVSATGHLHAVDAMVHHRVMDDLHAVGVKNEETRHPVAGAMNGVIRRLSADAPHVTDGMSSARHLVSASPLHDQYGAPFYGQMKNRNAVFSHAYLILYSLYSCAPSPTVHHF